MKTLPELNIRINELLAKRTDGLANDCEKKKAGKELALATKCRNYLEQVNPSPELVKRDERNVKLQLKKIKDGYEAWLEYRMKVDAEIIGLRSDTKRKARYHKDMGKEELTAQLKTLQYLLS